MLTKQKTDHAEWGTFPFNKECEGYKCMIEKFEDGTTSPDMAPKEAYQSDPLFFHYSETAVKMQLKNWKNGNGLDQHQANNTPAGGSGTCKFYSVFWCKEHYSNYFNVDCCDLLFRTSPNGWHDHSQAAAMMEDGLSKLGNMTSKFNNFGP